MVSRIKVPEPVKPEGAVQSLIAANDERTRDLVPQEVEAANQQVFDTRQAAAFLGYLHPQTLVTWRAQKCGPPFHKPEVGGIFYLRSDLLAWLARGRVEHSAAEGAVSI